MNQSKSLTKCVQQFFSSLILTATGQAFVMHTGTDIVLQYLSGTPHSTKAFVCAFLILAFPFPSDANSCSWITANIKFFVFHLEYKLIINSPTNFKSNIPLISIQETGYPEVFRGFTHHFQKNTRVEHQIRPWAFYLFSSLIYQPVIQCYTQPKVLITSLNMPYITE